MTPHLRTFIDAIESAAGKRDASELTGIEKVSICVSLGIDMWLGTTESRKRHPAEWVEMSTKHPVVFEHDGGNWQVIELK